jgi:hypothetical protein
MPQITVSDAAYAKLQAWAQGRNQTVDQMVESLVPDTISTQNPPTDREFDQLLNFIRSKAVRIPPNHVVNCDRATIYTGREE